MVKEYVTESGFAFSVDPDLLDDADLFDLFMEAEEGNPTAMMKAYKKALGDDQYKKAKDFLRDETGRCKTSELIVLLEACLSTIEQVKN